MKNIFLNYQITRELKSIKLNFFREIHNISKQRIIVIKVVSEHFQCITLQIHRTPNRKPSLKKKMKCRRFLIILPEERVGGSSRLIIGLNDVTSYPDVLLWLVTISQGHTCYA